MDESMEVLGLKHSEFSCHTVYDASRAFLQLDTVATIEVDMIVEGRGLHYVRGQDIPCRVGDIFVIPPNTAHGYFVERDEDVLTVRRIAFSVELWFEGDTACAGRDEYCYGVFRENAVIACAILNASKRELIEELYDAIENELGARGNKWQHAIRGYLAILFIHIERYVDCAIKDVCFASSKDWETVLSVLHITQERYSDPELTLSSLAEKAYVSKTYLSGAFKRVTGKRFSDHLRELRLDHARELLARTELTVEEIVAECGLRDVPSFYRNFSTAFHQTPNEYRRATVRAGDGSEQYKKLLKGEKVMNILNDICVNVQIGKAKIVKEQVQAALDEGVKPVDILSLGLLAGMGEIGEKFKNNEVYVPEVLVAARAMNMGMEVLKPHLVALGVKAKGKVCIGTVQGDLHDIGKNLVKMMMEGKGLEVVDLGVDVAPETFIKAVVEDGCQVICCSALLTTTMGVMEEVVKAAEAAGIRDKVKIMIGGAPVSQEFCDKIGADCYTNDAASAADAAVAFCQA